MNKIVFLPGYSNKNEFEQNLISDAIEKRGLSVYRHKWRHWSDETIQFDEILEIENILKNFDKDVVGIVGKSIGTYIAAKLLQKLQTTNYKLKTLILMGIPFNDLDEGERLSFQVLKNQQAPIFLIHNVNDPHGNLAQVEEFMKEIPHTILSKEADHHAYEYPNDVLNILRQTLPPTL